jgi:predicted nucleic acid-binding protein
VIVLDASAAVHLVLRTERGEWVAERGRGEERHVPQVFEYEVVAGLRRQVLARAISSSGAGEALKGLGLLARRRYPPQPLLERIWALRATLTPYDASYVALAEALDAPLVTADARLARSHGHVATIELVPS